MRLTHKKKSQLEALLQKKARKNMDVQAAKKTLHEMIDQIEDDELLILYVKLLDREIKKISAKGFFNTTESELVERAKASLASVEAGKTRPIKDFKKDIEAWRKQQAM